jgi:rhomboid domain-containing protein 1
MRRGGGARRGPMDRLMLLMLVMRIVEFGLDRIPPVTLATTGFCIAIALEVLPAFRTFARGGACFTAVPLLKLSSMDTVSTLATLKRGIQSHFVHLGDWHLYYTMLSWLYKARAEELRVGSEFFLLWVLVAALGTTILFIALSATLVMTTRPSWFGFGAEWLDPNSCAVGMTGIIFALKAARQYDHRRRDEAPPQNQNDQGDRFLYGAWGGLFWDPFAWAPSFVKNNVWLEVVFVELIAPEVSLLWHLSGVMCGVVMVQCGVDKMLRGPARQLRALRESVMANIPRNDNNNNRRN